MCKLIEYKKVTPLAQKKYSASQYAFRSRIQLASSKGKELS